MGAPATQKFGTSDRSVLIIDNYDSFTFNVVQQLARVGASRGFAVEVLRNDVCSVSEALALAPQAVVISPGPRGPGECGISDEILAQVSVAMPILGVCLGHQIIAHHFGAQVCESGCPMHGRTSVIEHTGRGLFSGIPDPFRAARYHSLMVVESTLPAVLDVTAFTAEGTIMALQHRTRPIWGVQFHPESFLTEYGDQIIANFLDLTLAAWT